MLDNSVVKIGRLLVMLPTNESAYSNSLCFFLLCILPVAWCFKKLNIRDRREATAFDKIANTLHRLGLLFFLEFLLCSWMDVNDFKSFNDNNFSLVSKTCAIVLLILLTSSTLVWAGITVKFSRDFEPNRRIKHANATLYLGMYGEILDSSNIYVLAFLCRRAIYVIVMLFLSARPAGQVFILVVTSTAVGSLVGNY